jgi:hypothetical protein
MTDGCTRREFIAASLAVPTVASELLGRARRPRGCA